MSSPGLPCWLAVLALAPLQDDTVIPPSPFDREIALELTADAAQGPTRVVEYDAEFEGLLHIWTRSELELTLRVEDEYGEEIPPDEESEEEVTTPYVLVDVLPGERLTIVISGTPGAAGPVALHLVAAPETDPTFAAADSAWDRVTQLEPLLRKGDHTRARKIVARTLELWNVPGAETSEELADAFWELGFLASEVGSTDACFEIWRRQKAYCERTLPPDHPGTLVARTNLAASLAERGDIAGARRLEELVLAGYERTLPPDHPELLSARANLAVSVAEMGDLAGARALEEAVVAGYERTLPADHVELLGARANLAVSMADMGDVAGARLLEESVLAALERTLPADHPEVLAARSNLAVSMEETGDIEGARALREAVLAAYERTLPSDHFDLLSARSELALSMHRAGDLAGARALRESVLAGYERAYPAEHIDLLSARADLAHSLHALGELGEARAHRAAVLEARERTLPAGHPDRLAARAALAISVEATDGPAAARELLPALCAEMRARILAALALAPRQARQAIDSEAHRLAELQYFGASAGAELQTLVFELTETMRLVAAEAARSLARFDGDPELAPVLEEAAAVRSALNDLIAGAGREEQDPETVAAELTRLSLERDRLEREATRQLAERGVVTRAADARALAAALGETDALVGYRRMPHWTKDEESGQLAVGTDHLLAHVLRSDGGLTRLDLGPAAELEELADAWRTALGAPLLRALGTADDELEPRAGTSLRKRILDPILAVAGEGVQRLFVCPDDFLFLLPLDSLPLEEGGPVRLGDRVRVQSEVSFARLLGGEEPVAGEPSLLAFGGVDYDAPGAAPEELLATSAPIGSDAEVEEPDPEEDLDDPDDPGDPGDLGDLGDLGDPDDLDDPDDLGDLGAPETGTTRSSMPGSFQKLLQGRYETEATADLFEEAFHLEPGLLTRKRATKAALFEEAPGKRFVHLATHGWFAPETVRSIDDARTDSRSFATMGIEERVRGLAPMTLCGLALAGANRGRDSLGRVPGILTAEELCSLDLSQCELAVLSACETNVGIRRAGQGIQSLQAALYAAGSRTSITSLWKVDDAATRRLMEVFYTNLWLEELPKAEALWQAKVALREEGHPPSDWAGWILTGEPD